MITTETVTVLYDFDPEYIWTDIAGIIAETGVEPISVKVYNNRIWDNVEMEFGNRELAILLTECYLQSDDPADIQEYVNS